MKLDIVNEFVTAAYALPALWTELGVSASIPAFVTAGIAGGAAGAVATGTWRGAVIGAGTAALFTGLGGDSIGDDSSSSSGANSLSDDPSSVGSPAGGGAAGGAPGDASGVGGPVSAEDAGTPQQVTSPYYQGPTTVGDDGSVIAHIYPAPPALSSGTLQIGLGGSLNIPLGVVPAGVSVPLGFGFAIDRQFNAGFYGYGGAGGQIGAEEEAGLNVSFSNAKNIADLRGSATVASYHGGIGFGGSVDYFSSVSPDGPVKGIGFTVGEAIGASAATGGSVTYLCTFFDGCSQ